MRITAPMQPSISLTFTRPPAHLQRKCKATDFLDTSDSPGGVETIGMEIAIFKIIGTVIIYPRTHHLDTALRIILCNIKTLLFLTLSRLTSFTFIMFLHFMTLGGYLYYLLL
jgi:hypothetical protein